MGSLTADRPKPLVEVAGRPLLEHCFDALGFADAFVVVVGHRGEQIRTRYGEHYRGTPVRYVDQSEPLGLADAVLRAEPEIEGPFVSLNADNVFRADLGRVATTHRESAADATLLVERVSSEVARTSGVVVRDEAGRVERVVEKPEDPPSRLVQTGFFAFDPSVFDACRGLDPSDRGEYELSDAMSRLAETGRVETVELSGWRVNVNTPADVARVERRLQAGD